MRLAAQDLHLFAEIIDQGGITGAARSLAMPKSSVSRRLAAIEAALGTRLLQRTTRALSLTEAGEVLLGYARRVIEELENADAAVAALGAAPRGHLAVTAPYAIVRFALAPRLHAFLSAHPGIAVTLTPAIEILDLVEHHIDVALRIGDLPPSGNIARRLSVVPLVLVTTPAYLAAAPALQKPEDLSGHQLIALGGQAAPRTLRLVHDHDRSAADVAVVPRVAIGEPAVVVDLVASGLGIGVAPLIYAAAGLRDGTLVRVLPGWTCGAKPVHAVYPSRALLAPKVTAFIAFAAACMAAVGDEAGL